jgi:hypothetical protein
MSDDQNPPLRIPEDMDGVHEIAKEEEEDGMTKEQRRNLAEAQANLRGF